MRTHIDLDEQLLIQAMNLGAFPTKKAAVVAALEDLVKSLKRKQLLALRGKVQWHGDLALLRSTRSDSKYSAKK